MGGEGLWLFGEVVDELGRGDRLGIWGEILEVGSDGEVGWGV